MSEGTIIKWDDSRGFGFIERDTGESDVFAHAKYFALGTKPTTGLRVAFDIVKDDRDPRDRADNVRAV